MSLKQSFFIGHIGVDILPVCPKITKLSFTLRSGDWAAFFAETKTNRQLLKNLKKLLSIEIIAANDCEPNNTFLNYFSFCLMKFSLYSNKAIVITWKRLLSVEPGPL